MSTDRVKTREDFTQLARRVHLYRPSVLRAHLRYLDCRLPAAEALITRLVPFATIMGTEALVAFRAFTHVGLWIVPVLSTIACAVLLLGIKRRREASPISKEHVRLNEYKKAIIKNIQAFKRGIFAVNFSVAVLKINYFNATSFSWQVAVFLMSCVTSVFATIFFRSALQGQTQ